MPQPLELHWSRKRLVVPLILSLLFIAGSMYTIRNPMDSTTEISAWIALVFFGPGAVLFISMIVRPTPLLRLDEHGITTMPRPLFRRRAALIPWNITAGFIPTYHVMQPFIAIIPKDESALLAGRSPRGRWLMEFTIGSPLAVPANVDMKPQDLAALMERYRTAYAEPNANE